MKLKSKKYKHYKGKVYDITVKDSHSYNVEGLAVHNSSASSLVCYLSGITDIDPIEHGLLFERFINKDRCFIENTIVKTNDKFKKIKDARIGEFVITHTGEKKVITNIFSYDKDEWLVSIEYDGSMFTCTKNHSILIRVNNNPCCFITSSILVELFDSCNDLYLIKKNGSSIIISDIMFSYYKGKVYDLEIKDNHSYQVFGIKTNYKF